MQLRALQSIRFPSGNKGQKERKACDQKKNAKLAIKPRTQSLRSNQERKACDQSCDSAKNSYYAKRQHENADLRNNLNNHTASPPFI
jgi:hypothetical protein